jgi:cell division protein FtsB
MRILTLVLVLLLITLQFRLWVGKGSLAEVYNLKNEISELEGELAKMRERNQELLAEVRDLQSKREWIEERAREDLGMVRKGEVFYQVIEPRDDDERPR